jgi:hypothetical protein
MYRSRWEETANPVYVWEAIAVCTKHERSLPDWVMAYLAVVAKLMMSEEARAVTDLRGVLPSIMGFPAKRGPGRPLDPDGGMDDAMHLAILFAIEIEGGHEPDEALFRASVQLPVEVADHDERTLWLWVMQAVGLERRPKTKAEWRAALRSHYGAVADLAETGL